MDKNLLVCPVCRCTGDFTVTFGKLLGEFECRCNSCGENYILKVEEGLDEKFHLPTLSETT